MAVWAVGAVSGAEEDIMAMTVLGPVGLKWGARRRRGKRGKSASTWALEAL